MDRNEALEALKAGCILTLEELTEAFGLEENDLETLFGELTAEY